MKRLRTSGMLMFTASFAGLVLGNSGCGGSFTPEPPESPPDADIVIDGGGFSFVPFPDATVSPVSTSDASFDANDAAFADAALTDAPIPRPRVSLTPKLALKTAAPLMRAPPA